MNKYYKHKCAKCGIEFQCMCNNIDDDSYNVSCLRCNIEFIGDLPLGSIENTANHFNMSINEINKILVALRL